MGAPLPSGAGAMKPGLPWGIVTVGGGAAEGAGAIGDP